MDLIRAERIHMLFCLCSQQCSVRRDIVIVVTTLSSFSQQVHRWHNTVKLFAIQLSTGTLRLIASSEAHGYTRQSHVFSLQSKNKQIKEEAASKESRQQERERAASMEGRGSNGACKGNDKKRTQEKGQKLSDFHALEGGRAPCPQLPPSPRSLHIVTLFTQLTACRKVKLLC